MTSNWHSMTVEVVCAELQTSISEGISSEQAELKLKQFGPNVWGEQVKTSPWRIFLNQFINYMVPTLVVAAGLSWVFGELLDAIVILVILILNAVLGFIQEFRADNALAALKTLSTPWAVVVRDGQVKNVEVDTLIPGDVVLLEEGSRVPADLRLGESTRLQVDEAVLTGESFPVEKSHEQVFDQAAELSERFNMVFMGTVVTQGVAKGVVTNTGKATQMGQISKLLENNIERETPLSLRMEELGKVLLGFSAAIIVLFTIFGYWQGHDLFSMIHTGISLAVAVIPEGLPAIVTVSLALGVQRLIKRKALIRRLPAVETLGSASVICTDKTGTLTENKMTVTTLWSNGTELEVLPDSSGLAGFFRKDGKSIDPNENPTWKLTLLCGALCNNASLRVTMEDENKTDNEKKQWIVQGDPTEGALLVAATKAGWDRKRLREWKRIKEYPFDSIRKQMSVIVEDVSKQRLLFVKGAPEMLLDRCVSWLDAKGETLPLNDLERNRFLEANDLMASRAMRVLALAHVPLDNNTELPPEDNANNLTFLGLMGIIDPVQEGVKGAVQNCLDAGIRIVMITGDQPATAKAIASELGLLADNSAVVTGKELAEISPESFVEKVKNITVYARTTPLQKLQIVKAWQEQKQVVAMTGDGVNDAPALKAADIGIAMGRKGTDVAKEAASLILVDDNFNTIAAAVEEGRGIYENIRKTIRFLLGGNTGELVTMVLALVIGLPLPLVPLQILWINLLTDGLPAVALGADSNEDNLMRIAPRPTNEGIFARGLAAKIINRGVMIGLVTLGLFSWSLERNQGDLPLAQTIAFATLATAQLVHAFDARSSISIFRRKLLANQFLNITVFISFLLLIAVIYVPALQGMFHTRSLPPADWGLIILASLIPSLSMSLYSELIARLKPAVSNSRLH
ncbi:MAG: cation-translocating P-type ATPase [Carboxydocellales bacterium]